MGRMMTLVLGMLVAAAMPLAAIAAADTGKVDRFAATREEQVEVAVALDDDDDDGDTSGDATGSRHTSVSRDRDRSRGGLTRDRTNDGPGSNNRDWTGGRTNDASRHDTR